VGQQVAGSVGVFLRAVPVVGAAVELDYEASGEPRGVYDIAMKGDVVDRLRNVRVGSHQVVEAVLELGLGVGRVLGGFDERSQVPDASARLARERLDRLHVEDPLAVGFVPDALEPGGVERARQSARSRGTVVTGMPSTVVRCSGASDRGW
jgi:hypothetical protein